MKIIAIIPARGGSRGLKDKNIRPLLGQPLIAHTIRACRKSELIDNVFVSTDSHKISEVSKKYGAYVIARPPELAQDDSQSEEALIHAMKRIGYCDIVVFLQCTSPIRREGELDFAIKKLINQRRDSAFTATEVHQYLRFDGYGRWHWTKYRHMRQDKKPAIIENGNFYVMRTEGLLNYGRRLFGKKLIIRQPWWCGLEVDTEEDLEACELLMRWKLSELA